MNIHAFNGRSYKIVSQGKCYGIEESSRGNDIICNTSHGFCKYIRSHYLWHIQISIIFSPDGFPCMKKDIP